MRCHICNVELTREEIEFSGEYGLKPTCSNCAHGEKTMKGNWMKSLTEFKENMHHKILENMLEKELSWKRMSNEQLLPLIQKYVERRDFVSVANIAFMLWDNSHHNSAVDIQSLFEEEKKP